MSDIITVTGNVAGDPEQRQLNSGGQVTSFRLASTHRRRDRETNEWVDAYTNWFTVSVYRALGEHAYLSLRKGDRVIVTGRFRLREWETGTKRGVAAEIDADAVGHDLLWGTTSFQRSLAVSSASADDAPEGGARPDEDGWMPPVAREEPVPADTPF